MAQLKIAGITLGDESSPASQGYTRLLGATTHRMLDGAARKQTHWQKLGVEISGSGWAPPALAGVDWRVPVEIACITPRVVASASAVATLPAARRADLPVNVLARALVGGLLVDTPVSLLGDVATATAVSGASRYEFWYYPLLTCLSDGPQESLDTSGAVYSWSLTAEEA